MTNAESHVARLRAKLLGRNAGTGAAAGSLANAASNGVTSAAASAAAGVSALAPAPSAKVKIGPEHYDFAKFPELGEYTNTRWYYDKQDYTWNMFREHAGVSGAVVEIDGRQLINFSSFNYLDLAGDPRVKDASKRAIDSHGTSTGSSRMISGEISLYTQFEQAIAAIHGAQDAIVAVAGYAANACAIGYIARSGKDMIIYDELVHNSALTGCKISGARRFAFAHNDCDALERILVEHRGSYERALILTEGVFSMDGDIPDLPRMIEIKKRHKALLMVDEAHSIGVLGPRGLGVVDHFGLNGADIDMHFSSMSKAFSTGGGYVAGKKELITLLKHYAPGMSLYSASPTPANIAAGLESLRIMLAEPERGQRVRDNADYFRRQAKAAGLSTGNSASGSGVIPLMVRDGELAVHLSVKLFDQGVMAYPMIFPVVPRNAARLRFFINAAHTTEQIDRAIGMITSLIASAPASKGLI